MTVIIMIWIKSGIFLRKSESFNGKFCTLTGDFVWGSPWKYKITPNELCKSQFEGNNFKNS